MTARAVASEGLATTGGRARDKPNPWRFAQRCATNPPPFDYVRTVIAPAWRGADGLARRLRSAMHLPEGPQAHNAHYANARRKERATGGQRVCVMRRYVKCMAASAVTGREQNARPSTARRSSPDGKRSAQGAGMCRGAQRAASAAGAQRSPEQPGAAQRQPHRGKSREADSRGVRPGTSGRGRWPGGKAGVNSAGRTAAAGHFWRRRPGGFWPGRAGRHGVGDARRAAKAAGLAAPGHGARSRRSPEAQCKASASALAWGVRHGGGRAGERPFAGLPGRVAVGRSTCTQRRCDQAIDTGYSYLLY